MSYVQLTLQERYVIHHLRLCMLSIREIARRLGRSHSTISRELRRNAPYVPHWPYRHEFAHERAMARRLKPRHRRRQADARLVGYVVEKLHAHWSPETIAGRLPIEFPRSASMRVAPETIYRWVYRDAAAGGLLYRQLRFSHRRRRRQRRYGSLRGLIRGGVPISARPAVVEGRRRFGDWEGDTIYGSRSRECLLTHVERKSRYLLASKLADRRAATTAQGQLDQFARFPATWRRTLTLDRGSEFVGFRRVETATGLRVFFAEPYCAWQRGASENGNGLVRRYYPKGTDFSGVSDAELASVVHRINNRPRKCLGYRTPQEVLEKALGGALGM